MKRLVLTSLLLLALVGEPSQAQPGWLFSDFPGGVADFSRRVAFVQSHSGVLALGLNNGESLWEVSEAGQLAGACGSFLVCCRSEGGRLRVTLLDPADGRPRVTSPALALDLAGVRFQARERASGLQLGWLGEGKSGSILLDADDLSVRAQEPLPPDMLNIPSLTSVFHDSVDYVLENHDGVCALTAWVQPGVLWSAGL